MTEDRVQEPVVLLSDRDRLNLHQLRLIEWMESRVAAERKKRSSRGAQDPTPLPQVIPERWALTRDVALYSWQKDCIQSWFDAGHKGTVKVVTGGGKSLLALAIAERLQNEE